MARSKFTILIPQTDRTINNLGLTKMARTALKNADANSVAAWARKNFADDFLKIPTCNNYTLQRIDLPNLHDSKGQLKGIVVGTAFEKIRDGQYADIDVLAWLESKQVVVGYISQVGWRMHAVAYKNILDANIRFHEPFSWILDAGDETAVLRFESLIRHGFSLLRFTSALKDVGNFAMFKTHFPGACRDIAEKSKEIETEWRRITEPLESSSSVTVGRSLEPSRLVQDDVQSLDDCLMITTPLTESSVEIEPVNRLTAECSSQIDPNHQAPQRMLISSIFNTAVDSVTGEKHQGSSLATPMLDLTEDSSPTAVTNRSARDPSRVRPANVASEPLQDGIDPFERQLQRMAAEYARFKASQTNNEPASASEVERLNKKVYDLENDLVLADRESFMATNKVAEWERKHKHLSTELEQQRNENKSLRHKLGMAKDHTTWMKKVEERRTIVFTHEKQGLLRQIQGLQEVVASSNERAGEAVKKMKEAQSETNKAREETKRADTERTTTGRVCADVRRRLRSGKASMPF